MKLKKLVLASAMAFAVNQAFALPPTTTPDVQVFISGSSAVQGALGAIVAGMMPGGYDKYMDTQTTGSNYRAYFGTVSGTGTSLDGKKVLVHNRALGGSFQGVGPLARAQAISRMTIDGTCVLTSGTYLCPNTVNAVPDLGVSDVEPALFITANLPSGQVALSPAEMAKITASSTNSTGLGIAVTDNLYNAGVTNLSHTQIASLMLGSYTDWSLLGVSGVSGPVLVQRREAGSGTQAGTNNYFGGAPCAACGLFMADATVASNPTSAISGYTVVQNGDTGTLVASLNASYNVGNKAIGLIGLNKQPGASDHWHFVSIDGVAPTLANLMNGNYGFYVEQSIQQRNTTVNGVAAPSGNVATFLATFTARAEDPAILGPLGGLLALPTNFDPTVNANTAKATKQGNSCAPSQLYY
ncbi:MAG TPA: hypothetical protein DCQ77_00250 [Betaproteobacteria bacterium]|nr:hypothetical protein [Betaproteobacteria bacterium]